jgi:hypothetical protein
VQEIGVFRQRSLETSVVAFLPDQIIRQSLIFLSFHYQINQKFK